MVILVKQGTYRLGALVAALLLQCLFIGVDEVTVPCEEVALSRHVRIWEASLR